MNRLPNIAMVRGNGEMTAPLEVTIALQKSSVPMKFLAKRD